MVQIIVIFFLSCVVIYALFKDANFGFGSGSKANKDEDCDFFDQEDIDK